MLFYIFFISLFSFLSLFKLSCTKTYQVYNLYRISCTSSFCYVIYYVVSQIYISGRFLRDFFYCFSQQFMSTVANESLIPYNHIKRAAETQSYYYCNTECQLKANQKYVKYSSVLKTKDFGLHKYEQ